MAIARTNFNLREDIMAKIDDKDAFVRELKSHLMETTDIMAVHATYYLDRIALRIEHLETNELSSKQISILLRDAIARCFI